MKGKRGIKGKVIFLGLCWLMLLGIKGVANVDDLLQASFDTGAPAVVNFTTEMKATITNVSTQTVTNVSAQLSLPIEKASVVKLFVNNVEQSATTTITIGDIGTATSFSIRWQVVFTTIGTYTITFNVTHAEGTITTSGIKYIFRNPNIIIADIENNRVIEVDSDKNTIWEYTNLIDPHDAKKLANGNVLITEHSRHRVIEVDRDKNIVWQYGITDNAGSGYNQLNYPVRASRLSNGKTLIVDHGNHRVIEVNRDKQIVWQMTGLYYPCDARKLTNGNVLITDSGNNRVIEVNVSNNSIVWEYGGLNYPWGAYRTKDGTTLIADNNNNRVIEVDYGKRIIWEYKGLNHPASAIELTNGNILISDRYNHRVMEVNRDKVVLWQYGETGISGSAQQHLNQPFSVEEVFLPTSGCISGKVTRASDGMVLSNVTIEILQDGTVTKTTTTLSDGDYIVDLPAGTYSVKAKAMGYISQIQVDKVVKLGYCVAEVDFVLELAESRTITTLIVDYKNHRVIEVDSDKNILWQYGITGSAGSGVGYLNHPIDAVRLSNGNTLITDHSNHRVIEVDRDKRIIWQYGITGSAGSGDNQLNSPYSAIRLNNGNTLITDHSNHRVIEVTRGKQIVWSFGVYYPSDAIRLSNGNTLIADRNHHRVIEVDTPTNNIIWEYGGFRYPASVFRLSNGNTLIADDHNHYVIEVNPNKEIVWQYGVKGNTTGDNRLNHPASIIELSNGNLLITDHNKHRVIEVNRDKIILWQYGITESAGSTFNRLYHPWDAKEVLPPTSGCISGKVTKASDGGVVSGVTIRALQNGVGKGTVTTLSDGTYILDLPAGTYILEALITGYVHQTKEGIEVIVGQTTSNVDFLLIDLFQHIPAYLSYPIIPASHGLIGEYYDNQDFTNLKLVRTDANINFDWGYDSPHSSIGSDYFSIRWTGWLKVDIEDTYTFYTWSNNGVRFLIDNKLVIDYWVGGVGATDRSGSIQLSQGLHQLKLEYFEDWGHAQVKLYWSSSSISKAIIPTTHLHESFYSYPIGAYQVKVKILSPEYQLNPSSLKVYYRINEETTWNSIPMSSTGVEYEYLAIIPSQPAGTKVHYYIEAKDTNGNVTTSPTEYPTLKPYQFKVVALNIISTTPKDDTKNVSVASDIKLVFSNSMSPATIGSQTIKVMIGTATVDGVYSYNDEDKTVTFEPKERLKEETTYQVVVTTQVQDTASNTIPAEYSFKFYTGLLGNLDDYIRVDGRDLIILGAAFGSTPEDTNWNKLADFNKEAESRDRIDSRDLSALASRFGRSSLLSAPNQLPTSNFQLPTSNSQLTTYDLQLPTNKPTIKLVSSKTEVSANQELTIKTLIENASTIYSYGFDLVFDTSKFEVIEVKEGNFLNQDGGNTSFMYVTKEGRVIIGVARLGEVSGISGSGILAEIILKAREDAPIKFTLQKALIEDTNLSLMEEVEIINLDYTQEITTQPKFKVFCYPNPAKDKIIFRFDLPKAGDVEIKVYNIAGELVRALEKKGLSQGVNQEVNWEPIDVASGIYIYKFVVKYGDGEQNKTIGKLGVIR